MIEEINKRMSGGMKKGIKDRREGCMKRKKDVEAIKVERPHDHV